MNRPEIQVLDSLPSSDPSKKQSRNSSFLRRPTIRKAPVTSRKRKSETSDKRRPRKPIHWAPDITHIDLPEKDERSTTVKFHGLPINCTVEQIRKFCAGLEPRQISILLPNDTNIPLLDACNGPPPHDRLWKTCESEHLRVMATFQSSPAAVLASERSGETIRMQDNNGEDQDFVIGVTVLPKALAKQLKQMSVIATPGVKICEASRQMVGNLHPMVGTVLWSVTAGAFHEISLDSKMRRDNMFPTDLGSNSENIDPQEAYESLAKHYNRLVDIHDELLHQLPYPVVDFDGSFNLASQDPLVRLTTTACTALTKELDKMEALLYRRRIIYQSFPTTVEKQDEAS